MELTKTLIGFVAIIGLFSNSIISFAKHPDNRNQGRDDRKCRNVYSNICEAELCNELHTEVGEDNAVLRPDNNRLAICQ